MLGLACALAAGLRGEALRSFEADLMHTRWRFTLVGGSAAEARAAFGAAAELIGALDRELAFWRPASALASVNAAAGKGQAVALGPQLAEALGIAFAGARMSDGAFDPTVGPLTQAWYTARLEGRSLGASEISKLRGLIGWEKVAWKPGQAILSLPEAGMRLDLGGLAKGYALDGAADLLRSRGYRSFLVNAGGQALAAGSRPGGSPWKLALRHPRRPKAAAVTLLLHDQVAATSGDYMDGRDIPGQPSHHLLDPHSGSFVDNGTVSMTIVLELASRSRPGTWADLLAKPAFIAGGRKGLAWAESQGAQALAMWEEGSRLQMARSPGLRTLGN